MKQMFDNILTNLTLNDIKYMYGKSMQNMK